MSLDAIMERIATGDILSRSEAGFTFVDILPAEAEHITPPPPATYMVLSEEELAALSEVAEPVLEMQPMQFMLPSAMSTDDEETAEPFMDEETPTFSASDWRRVRTQTARTRRPPPRLAALAA